MFCTFWLIFRVEAPRLCLLKILFKQYCVQQISQLIARRNWPGRYLASYFTLLHTVFLGQFFLFDFCCEHMFVCVCVCSFSGVYWHTTPGGKESWRSLQCSWTEGWLLEETKWSAWSCKFQSHFWQHPKVHPTAWQVFCCKESLLFQKLTELKETLEVGQLTNVWGWYVASKMVGRPFEKKLRLFELQTVNKKFTRTREFEDVMKGLFGGKQPASTSLSFVSLRDNWDLWCTIKNRQLWFLSLCFSFRKLASWGWRLLRCGHWVAQCPKPSSTPCGRPVWQKQVSEIYASCSDFSPIPVHTHEVVQPPHSPDGGLREATVSKLTSLDKNTVSHDQFVSAGQSCSSFTPPTACDYLCSFTYQMNVWWSFTFSWFLFFTLFEVTQGTPRHQRAAYCDDERQMRQKTWSTTRLKKLLA